MAQNKFGEITHDSRIKEDAEFLWGWATPAGRLRAKRRVDLIVNMLKKGNFTRLLEIGCGTGIFTEPFCKKDLKVTSIDISLELAKKTRQKCASYPKLQLSVSDVESLPFRDNSFDAAVGVCVLHHLNILPALREIKRVVKEKGIIIFSEPNMMNPQLMIQKNVKYIKTLPIFSETEDETAFFRWQMKRMLIQEIGFRDVSITPFDFLHPWTPKSLIPFVRAIGLCLEQTPFLREISGSLFITATK